MSAAPIRVLLLEDNPGDALLIRRMLLGRSADGMNEPAFDVLQADRLRTGLALLAEEPVDIILCDLSLPDSAGLETPVLVQNAAPTVPIVVLSGLDDEETALKAVHAGAQDYLVKGRVDEHLLRRSVRYAVERKRLSEQLRTYAATLEARNAELDAFAHTVAHDLKAPLSSLVGYAQVAIDHEAQMNPTERREMLAAISRVADKMVNIVQELLLLAQVSRTDVRSQPVHMLAVVEEACDRLEQMSIEQHGQITVEQPEQWPIVMGYEPWLEEVWVNYISNALKYGGESPQIQIGAGLDGPGMARFWVSDHGPGIACELQAGLFTEFERLGQAQISGTGLGLSIVRRIVEKLGGQVAVDTTIGGGATFSFTLPLAPPLLAR